MSNKNGAQGAKKETPPSGATGSAASGSATTNSSATSDDKLVWTKDQTKLEIKQLENQLSVAMKQHINRITLVDHLKYEYKHEEQPIVLGSKPTITPAVTRPAATPPVTPPVTPAVSPTITLTVSPPVTSSVTLKVTPPETPETKPTPSETPETKPTPSETPETKPTPPETPETKPTPPETPPTPAGEVESQLMDIDDKFSKGDLIGAQDGLIKCKNDLNVLISRLPHLSRAAYFISIWGVVPIGSALAGLIVSLVALSWFRNVMILGIVPMWAAWAAVLGASVQIFVGVVDDYRDDGIISKYKRLWYLVVLFVSFAFGLLAFLMVQAGFFNISGGSIVLNQALNQTISTSIPQVGTNQTVTQATTQSVTASSLAIPFILCFLAGYATDWFMATLGKITHTDTAKK